MTALNLGSWEPLDPTRVVALFTGADFRWWISGGHALELHLGRTWRKHDDLDVGVQRSSARAVHRWLDGWDLWLAADGQLTPWDGTVLDPGRSHNNIWIRREPGGPWNVDLTVGEGDDNAWRYRRNPEIMRPWEGAVLASSDGVPYLAPDLQLLYKSKAVRAKDQVDAECVIPELSAAEQTFLRAALSDGHPWRLLLEHSG